MIDFTDSPALIHSRIHNRQPSNVMGNRWTIQTKTTVAQYMFANKMSLVRTMTVAKVASLLLILLSIVLCVVSASTVIISTPYQIFGIPAFVTQNRELTETGFLYHEAIFHPLSVIGISIIMLICGFVSGFCGIDSVNNKRTDRCTKLPFLRDFCHACR